MEAANHAVRYHPSIRRWYERKRAQASRGRGQGGGGAQAGAGLLSHVARGHGVRPDARLRLITLTVAGRERVSSEPVALKGRDRRHPCCTQDRSGPSHHGLGFKPETLCDARRAHGWTDSTMTYECLGTEGP